MMDLALWAASHAAKCFDDKAKKAGKRDLVALIMFGATTRPSCGKAGLEQGLEWHSSRLAHQLRVV